MIGRTRGGAVVGIEVQRGIAIEGHLIAKGRGCVGSAHQDFHANGIVGGGHCIPGVDDIATIGHATRIEIGAVVGGRVVAVELSIARNFGKADHSFGGCPHAASYTHESGIACRVVGGCEIWREREGRPLIAAAQVGVHRVIEFDDLGVGRRRRNGDRLREVLVGEDVSGFHRHLEIGGGVVNIVVVDVVIDLGGDHVRVSRCACAGQGLGAL